MNGSPDSAHSSADAAKVVRPEREELRAKLHEWILWVRERIGSADDIPSVLDIFRAAIDDSSGKELLFAAVPDGTSREKLESCWGDELTQTPADLAVRAAVLCCAWWKLAVLESELLDWSDSGDEAFIRSGIEDGCTRARQAIGFLVRFLPVEECARTWRDFRWEILNSYLAHDWDRAAHLYNRAEDLRLKPAGEIAVVRGQFRFLCVFDDRIQENARRTLKDDRLRLGLDTLSWEPRIYRPNVAGEDLNELLGQILYTNGMCDGDRQLILRDSDKALLLDAAHDLEKGFQLIPNLPYFYRGVLGRCFYCVGRFHDAAEQYCALLQSETGLPKPSARLFASLNLSYRQGGESACAKEILERWAREFPGEKGVYLQLAELEAQSGDYHGVGEYLRKEMERNPAVDTDWKLSALLALGATQDTSEAIKNELKENSDLWNPVCSMLSEYWAPFSKLGEKGREKWTFGMVLASSSGLPERMRLNEAAVACIGAVEIEFRDRVFSKYREHVLGHGSVKTTAESGLRNPRSSKLCQFLVHDGSLTLGEMAVILKVCGRDDEPVLRDLRNWISRAQSRVMKNLDNLQALVAFRNPAVHENRIEVNPKQIIQSCRTIIEALN